jgi:uncharacterized protein (DUF1684 family)
MVDEKPSVKAFKEIIGQLNGLEATMSNHLELVDYRSQVADLYAAVRKSEPSRSAWEAWRRSRDHIFATHPQSPIEDRNAFASLPFFAYEPEWRTEAVFRPVEAIEQDVANSGSDTTRFTRIGEVEFDLRSDTHSLGVFWLDAYGGGMFIPFRDHTNGVTTYGGGRYLIDTVKGADLGRTENGIVLDFNYAYHPSCVHSPRWSCPLAPPANVVGIEVTAGEQLI